MHKKKLFIVTTIPMSFVFFKGQISVLKNKFNVTLISSPEKLLFETASHYYVKSHAVNMKREISLLHDFISLLKLIVYFIMQKPDMVHGNTPKGSFLSMAASWICKVPTRVYYVHGLRYQETTGLKRSLLKTIERLSCYFATNVIAVSEGVRKKIVTDNITKKMVDMIWNGSINGVNMDYFDPTNADIENIRTLYGITDKDFVFGFVGRLVGDKGINELVESFCRLNKIYSNTKLLLVGGAERELDPLLPETLRKIEREKDIITVGFKEDIRPYLLATDLFVFPSYREGFGMVLLEAAAMNTPAISSDIIGCNEIIQDGINGYLIPAKDAEALFDKMKFSVENPHAIKEMSLRARTVTEKKYEQKTLWKKILEKYVSLSY